MPLYEYECLPNKHRFEVRHGINEPPVKACPECGGEVRRVIQPVGVVFKGTGFYVTDSRKANAASKPSDSKTSDSDGGSQSGKSDTKTDDGAKVKPDSKKESAAN